MAVTDQLMAALRSGGLDQLGAGLGLDPAKAEAGVEAALPVLVGALAKNAAKPEGAAALEQALERDHDGSVLEQLGAAAPDSLVEQGGGILRHVLGGKAPKVEQGLAEVAGLGSDQAGRLLAALAPLVMGALGKARRQTGLDAGGLAGLLAGEARAVTEKAPQARSLLSGLLDADGDGDVDAGDLLKRGSGLLGGLFGGSDR
ncbi:MAG: DUF937 domain-containing protein [Acidobacteria bacterium]|nr:MAG: DUF937 domain-containing protein [Acidobacteriota bacterium]